MTSRRSVLKDDGVADFQAGAERLKPSIRTAGSGAGVLELAIGGCPACLRERVRLEASVPILSLTVFPAEDSLGPNEGLAK